MDRLRRDYRLKKGSWPSTKPEPPTLGSINPEFGGKQRKCGGCGLSTVNYFRCNACTSHNQAAYYMEAMGGVAY